jgi:hypothetical protein
MQLTIDVLDGNNATSADATNSKNNIWILLQM